MKYIHDAVFEDRNGERRYYSKEYDHRHDAEMARVDIQDKVKPGECVTWNKVYPVVTCQCGEEVHCVSFTNTCSCGADYNFAGQELAPREQWGEETGETWSECY